MADKILFLIKIIGIKTKVPVKVKNVKLFKILKNFISINFVTKTQPRIKVANSDEIIANGIPNTPMNS